MTDGGSRRRGRGQGQRLLYWFRTPPGVRVGRAPIDEQAMRLLEQPNPDVEFDWPRLLREAPPDPNPRRDRDRDPRERDRRERRDQRSPRPRPLDTTAAAVPPAPPPIVREATAEVAEERAAAHADRVLSESEDEPMEPPQPESLAVTHGEPLAADHTEYVEYAAASLAQPAHEGAFEPPLPPAASRIGPDGVLRLRARYAQIVARIAEKPMDDDARAQLNTRVERLNPDAWLTVDEVAAALEQYETVFDSLRADVGYHPPRRRRHGRNSA